MIRTRRLLLRPAREGDLEPLHQIMSDPRAMQYWSTPPHDDIAQTSAFLKAMIAAPADSSEDHVIEYAGRMVGKAGCWRLAELGVILHPDVWGIGLAAEALRAILPRVFEKFPQVSEITADVDPRNQASLHLLAALGFVETGRAARTFQIGDAWVDSVYLALPRP